MDYLPLILTISVVILTLTLLAVGVYVIQVLQRFKYTLDKVNSAIDEAEMKMNAVMSPLQSIGGVATSLTAGLKVFESFVGWVHREK
jgi:uncharacterized protein YoxC